MSDDSFDVFCPECNIQVVAQSIASGSGGFQSKLAGAFDESDAEYEGNIFHVATCPKCSSPFLIRLAIYGIPAEFETITSKEVLYPATTRLPLEGVSEPIRRSYEQASRCFGSSAYDACALMCRRAIEGVCKELGATSGTLQEKLEKLFNQGAIDAHLNQWAHGVRAVGNEAAHDVEAELTLQDARDALDFTEAILLYVFVLRARFSAFSSRRKN